MSEMIYVWIVLVFGIMPDCRSNMKFSRVESCYDPTQTPETYHNITGISVPLCGVMCARDKRCMSISIKRDGNNVTCYVNSERRLLGTGCDNQYRHLNGYHSSCHYHGVFLNDSYGCRCYGGYIGAWCERLMQDCSDGSTTDHYSDEFGVFHIHPNNAPRAFKVVCAMRWGRTYLVLQQFGSVYVNFSRPWEDYRNGFGNCNKDENFWTGLDMLHYVTNNRRHVMNARTVLEEDGNTVRKGHHYIDFKVSSENEGYNFTFTSTGTPRDNTSHALDGLSAFLGARFSTYDVDNDNDNNTNCANLHQSGWWFTTCDGYNPTGQPQPPSVQYKTSDPTQLSWPHPLNYSPVRFSMYLVV